MLLVPTVYVLGPLQVALAELANAIPRSSYLFGVSWPDVRRTLLVAVEQKGDPYAVMIPTLEVICFCYAPSTRLAQALFWGEYNETFSAGRTGVFEEGVVKVHLCFGSRLLPPSKRSFRRKTERRSAHS